MADIIFPESPVVASPLWSPERKGESSRRRRPSVRVASRAKAHPFVSIHPTPESVQAILQASSASPLLSGDLKGKGREQSRDPEAILRHALRWAVERADIELTNWLCGLGEEWAGLLDGIVDGMEDEDGWGLVGMAIQGSCGHREREAVVRAVVARWGLSAGPREGRDEAGWTPLHLASIISTPPLISFLLTRGASISAETDRGLRPFDLVADMPGREEISLLLEDADMPPPINQEQGDQRLHQIDSERRESLAKNRARAAVSIARQKDRERKARRETEREEWLREQSRVTAVEAELLLPPKRVSDRRSMDSGLGWMTSEDEDEYSDAASEDEDDLAGKQVHGALDDMLVFAPWNVTTLLDILVTRYRPHAQPTERRGLPANALHRYARFALAHWDEDCLEMFIGRALERIEHEIYEHDKDLARQAFWAYNTTLLLHLLKSDPALYKAECMPELMRMIEEMISAIHVFVIRLTEQRIDEILGAAILDYETLEEVSDVRFEGEWNLFGKTLTLKKKRDTIPRAHSIFANGANRTPEKSSLPSAASIFGSVKEGSPFRTPLRPQSTHDLRSSGRSVPDTPGTPLATDAAIEPTRVTEILSGILLVLQLYEINPAIIVQAFSQAFLWISGELFNRILSRKQYLCRSKAVQITMNITVLNDWVRANGLPAKTSTKHLEPLAQLLQWLQCLSGISDFDTLIITMQNMKALNPLQLRRAVRDYKYEVGESRMTEECTQYLVQLQKDWEKRRTQLGASHMRHAILGTDIDRAGVSIDSLFDGSTYSADWTPQGAPECLGELLDNRFMIPFVLPSDAEYLVAMPPFDIAFRSLAISSPFITDDASASSRPASRSSYSSSRPLGFRLPSARGIRRLPRDFFAWLKDKEAESRLRRDEHPTRSLAQAVDPLSVSGQPGQPAQLPNIKTANLPKVKEESDRTPIASSTSQPLHRASFPSPGLATSGSMDEMRVKARQQVHIPSFESLNPTMHKRTESYELKERPTPLRQGSHSSISAHPESPTPSRMAADAPMISPTGTGSGFSKKRWWDRNGSNGQGRREGSEDTIMEDLSTPLGHAPTGTTASEDTQFWSR